MAGSDGWVFIVNPVAGVGYGAACAQTVREMMREHRAAGEVVLTRGKGHASELAAEHASRGFPRGRFRKPLSRGLTGPTSAVHRSSRAARAIVR